MIKFWNYLNTACISRHSRNHSIGRVIKQSYSNVISTQTFHKYINLKSLWLSNFLCHHMNHTKQMHALPAKHSWVTYGLTNPLNHDGGKTPPPHFGRSGTMHTKFGHVVYCLREKWLVIQREIEIKRKMRWKSSIREWGMEIQELNKVVQNRKT